MARGRIATAICTALLASSIALTASATPGPGKWRAVAKVPGIVDVVGPRADGRLVLSTHSGLFVMRPAGPPVPYARGPQGYAGSPGEPYLTLGSDHRVPGTGCAFRRDVIFALDPDATPGIVRIDRSGRSSRFANLPAGAFPAGIATDTVGSFGYRIVVTSFSSGTTTLYAFDCRGRARVVATGAPHVEGGIAVAPRYLRPLRRQAHRYRRGDGPDLRLCRAFPPAGTSGPRRLALCRRSLVAILPLTSRTWDPRARRRAGRTAC
jgi:hypothetical protein